MLASALDQLPAREYALLRVLVEHLRRVVQVAGNRVLVDELDEIFTPLVLSQPDDGAMNRALTLDEFLLHCGSHAFVVVAAASSGLYPDCRRPSWRQLDQASDRVFVRGLRRHPPVREVENAFFFFQSRFLMPRSQHARRDGGATDGA